MKLTRLTAGLVVIASTTAGAVSGTQIASGGQGYIEDWFVGRAPLHPDYNQGSRPRKLSGVLAIKTADSNSSTYACASFVVYFAQGPGAGPVKCTNDWRDSAYSQAYELSDTYPRASSFNQKAHQTSRKFW